MRGDLKEAGGKHRSHTIHFQIPEKIMHSSLHIAHITFKSSLYLWHHKHVDLSHKKMTIATDSGGVCEVCRRKGCVSQQMPWKIEENLARLPGSQ